MATNVGAIAVAAVIGAGSAVLVLRANSPTVPDGASGTPVVASTTNAPADYAPAPAAPGADPWTAAAKPVPPARRADYPTRLLVPDELPDIRPQELADPELARVARDRFSQDCPAIVERTDTRNGRFDVICTNGVVLRVHAMDGELTRIGPVRHGRPVRSSHLVDD